MLRDAFAIFVVLSVLLLVGLFGWLTRQPEAPFFERAERAPVIGNAIAKLRSRYLPGGAPAPPAPREGVRIVRVEPPPWASRESPEREPHEREWVGIGATLREAPRTDAAPLAKTRELSSFDVLERRGSWVRVQLPDEREAWIDLAAPRDTTPPLGEEPLPPGPLPSRPADEDHLAEAIALLSSPPRETSIAGYRVLHDLDEHELTSLAPLLRATLEPAEELYLARYGVEPVGAPAETIVLYRDEASYVRLHRTLPELGSTPATGHTASGLVALFAGSRARFEVAATLAHEVGHLLARRALGPALPPWLDEGLADDFAAEAVARATGGDRYAAWREVDRGRVQYNGPLAGLALLLRRLEEGTLEPLAELVALDRSAFYAAPERERLYSQSGTFVHCLLGGSPAPEGGASRAKGFRSWLRAVAGGAAVSGDAFVRSLGASWTELEVAYRACLLLEGSRAGVARGVKPIAREPTSPREEPAGVLLLATPPSRRGSARASRSAPRS